MKKVLLFIQSKFKKNNIIDSFAKLFFFLSLSSVPVCSFKKGLNLITWVFVLLFCLFVFIQLIKKKEINISLFALVNAICCLSILVSSIINLFKSFSFTPFLLLALSSIISLYILNSDNKKDCIKEFSLIIYVALFCFLAVFCAFYFPDLIHARFDRLGAQFGDINDICLFLTLGSVFAYYFIFFAKKVIFKIVNVVLLFAFSYASISCGSKIFVLIFAVASILLPLIRFGKSKWYITMIFYIVFSVLIVLLFKIPAFSSLTKRLLSFFDLFSGNSTAGVGVDYSTIGRIDMFYDGFEMFLRKPLFGWGATAFYNYSSFGGGWSHNHFSECLCSYGISGFLLYNFPICYSLYKMLKDQKNLSSISFFIVLFFLLSMVSIALDGEKIYCLISPIALAESDSSTLTLNNFLVRKRKGLEINENCISN